MLVMMITLIIMATNNHKMEIPMKVVTIRVMIVKKIMLIMMMLTAMSVVEMMTITMIEKNYDADNDVSHSDEIYANFSVTLKDDIYLILSRFNGSIFLYYLFTQSCKNVSKIFSIY